MNEHRTSNIERRTLNGPRAAAAFDVQSSMFSVRCFPGI
jgi:hypothetical protein